MRISIVTRLLAMGGLIAFVLLSMMRIHRVDGGLPSIDKPAQILEREGYDARNSDIYWSAPKAERGAVRNYAFHHDHPHLGKIYEANEKVDANGYLVEGRYDADGHYVPAFNADEVVSDAEEWRSLVQFRPKYAGNFLQHIRREGFLKTAERDFNTYFEHPALSNKEVMMHGTEVTPNRQLATSRIKLTQAESYPQFFDHDGSFKRKAYSEFLEQQGLKEAVEDGLGEPGNAGFKQILSLFTRKGGKNKG